MNKEELAEQRDDEDEDCSLIKIFSKPTTTWHHDVYLDSYFDSDPHNYTELLHKLRSMSSQDTATFYLKNYGGDCQMAYSLCHAAKSCKGTITMFVESPCYSMGAIIALCGQKLHMNYGTFLMFHNYTATDRGKGAELLQKVKTADSWLQGQVKYLCSPFLTDKELAALAKDEDVYIFENKPGLAKRIKRHFSK